MNVKVNSTILLSQFNLFTTREVSAIIPPLRNFQVIAKKYVCPTTDDLCCILLMELLGGSLERTSLSFGK